jgi:aminopeptidase-like protein
MAIDLLQDLDDSATGEKIYQTACDLFPICRSITGDGVRQTLSMLARLGPNMKISEISSGEKAFDWTVPDEWNIRDAYIKDPLGRKIIDFRENNLHVLNYSVPVHAKMSLAKLRPHLYTIPEQPELVPYRTSYYARTWGFCLSHHQMSNLEEGEYEVLIESTLQPGSMTYGEILLNGAVEDEVMIYTHICHPSLANDNLSGMALTAHMANYLAGKRLRHSYRFIFAPGTIGSIAWLARNEGLAQRIKCGLVVCLVGDGGEITYKKSRDGDASIDRIARYVLDSRGESCRLREFEPYGYDERQFCSPGFNLPVGRLTRTPNGEYPEYHTSADNLDFISPDKLADSFRVLAEIIEVIENDVVFVSKNPKCEPQLGKRGLYRKTGGRNIGGLEHAMLWVLNQSDGRNSLLDIALRSGIPVKEIVQAADLLKQSELLVEG